MEVKLEAGEICKSLIRGITIPTVKFILTYALNSEMFSDRSRWSEAAYVTHVGISLMRSWTEITGNVKYPRHMSALRVCLPLTVDGGKTLLFPHSDLSDKINLFFCKHK